jgi:hypothetical protein
MASFQGYVHRMTTYLMVMTTRETVESPSLMFQATAVDRLTIRQSTDYARPRCLE